MDGEGIRLPEGYYTVTYTGGPEYLIRTKEFSLNGKGQYMAKILFRDWKPEAYVDHHHMGGNGARIYLPPYAEPVRPGADPILWRELSWYGAHMAYKEEEANLSGVINGAIYSGWGHFGFHWITPFHNIDGMLTEFEAVGPGLA